MTVKRFTKLPSGDQVLDRIQESLAQAVQSHASTVDSHTTSITGHTTSISTIKALLTNGLTFTSNVKAEWVTFTVTTPATDWIVVGSGGTAPAFQGTWANYDAANWASCSFMKDTAGFVHIRGHIKLGTVPSTVFTLPAGYRPNLSEQFSMMDNNAWGLCSIDTGGNVQVSTGTSLPPFASLAGITFRVPDFSPGVLSCFPANIPAKTVTNPKAILLGAVVDTSASAILQVPACSPVWSVTSTTSSGVTTYQPVLQNLSGLLPGSRTYSITLLLVGG